MEYRILTADTIDGLVQATQAALDEGWTPQGGVCWANGLFCQAMTKAM